MPLKPRKRRWNLRVFIGSLLNEGWSHPFLLRISLDFPPRKRTNLLLREWLLKFSKYHGFNIVCPTHLPRTPSHTQNPTLCILQVWCPSSSGAQNFSTEQTRSSGEAGDLNKMLVQQDDLNLCCKSNTFSQVMTQFGEKVSALLTHYCIQDDTTLSISLYNFWFFSAV